MLNSLIEKYKVECGTSGNRRTRVTPYERVRKIVFESFGVDFFEFLERNRLEKEQEELAKAERKAQFRKQRMEHLAGVHSYSVNFQSSLPLGMTLSPRVNTIGTYVSAVKERGQAQDLCVLERSVITRIGRNGVVHLTHEEIVRLIQSKQKDNIHHLTIHFSKAV